MIKPWLATMLVWLAVPAPAQVLSQPVTIGNSHKLVSTALGEERVINVILPATYGKEPAKRYPVVYLIDGGVDQDLLHVSGVIQLGAGLGRSSEAIIVGVETRDRRKELAGPTRDPELLKEFPTAGSSAAFRGFLRDEVMPLVQRTYRSNGQDMVIGESLAALFIIETYLVEPQLFDAYAAIDPSLWWDGEALSQAAAGKIGAVQERRPLYLAMAREQAAKPTAMNRLVAALRGKVQGWCLSARPDLTHATIYQQIIPQALQFGLPPASPPPAEFGFEVQCSQKP